MHSTQHHENVYNSRARILFFDMRIQEAERLEEEHKSTVSALKHERDHLLSQVKELGCATPSTPIANLAVTYGWGEGGHLPT